MVVRRRAKVVRMRPALKAELHLGGHVALPASLVASVVPLTEDSGCNRDGQREAPRRPVPTFCPHLPTKPGDLG